jgi:hypothetical protein
VPHAARDFELPVGVTDLGPDDIIELSAREPAGATFWTWVVRGTTRTEPAAFPTAGIQRRGSGVQAGDYALEFDPATGELAHLTAGGHDFPLTGPRLAAWQRTPGKNVFTPADPPRLTRLELAPADGSLARARYDGALREITWRLRGEYLVVSYEIAYEGPADILGIQFDFPESAVSAKRWVGDGPYRIWKNRLAGTQFGLHAANYSRSTAGETFEYPEFEGYFGQWRWLEMHTKSGVVAIRNESGIPYFGLYRPTPVEKPLLVLPDNGWAFLHAVPPIGTKFNLPDVLGPESQPSVFTGTLRGELALRFLR